MKALRVLGLALSFLFFTVLVATNVSANIIRFDFTGEIVSNAGSLFINPNPGDPFSGFFTYDDENNPDMDAANSQFGLFELQDIVVDGNSYLDPSVTLIIWNSPQADAIIIGDAGIHIQFQLSTTDTNLFNTDQLTALTSATYDPFPFPLQYQFENDGNTVELMSDSSTGFMTSLSYEGGNPVPEPSTLLLLGSGLVGLAGLRRKFRKN